MTRKPANSRKGEAPAGQDETYDLVLYISGATENSRRAVSNLKAIGEKHLKGRYRLAVVDLYQQPERAREHQIVFVPTLVKTLPAPMRRMIGDLSIEDHVLLGLDLVASPADPGK